MNSNLSSTSSFKFHDDFLPKVTDKAADQTKKAKPTKKETHKIYDFTPADASSDTGIRAKRPLIQRIFNRARTPEESNLKTSVKEYSTNLKELQKTIKSLKEKIAYHDKTNNNLKDPARLQLIKELETLNTKWESVEQNLNVLYSNLRATDLSHSKSVKEIPKLIKNINIKFDECTKQIPGTVGYDVHQLCKSIDNAINSLELKRTLHQTNPGVPFSIEKEVKAIKDGINQLEKFGRDNPTNAKIGSQVHELTTRARLSLFESGETSSLYLSLNRYNAVNKDRLVKQGEKNPVPMSDLQFQHDIISHLPKAKIKGLNNDNILSFDSKPKQGPDRYADKQVLSGGKIAAKMEASYLHDDAKNTYSRQNCLIKAEQNNDSFLAMQGDGWEMSLIADGGGVQSRKAAEAGKNAFANQINEHIRNGEIKTVQDMGTAMLNGFAAAHAAATQEGQSSTLTANLTFETKDGKTMAMVAGVGDSPIVVRRANGNVELLSPGMRDYTAAGNDPGGSIGGGGNVGDSRNFFINLVEVHEGDTLFIGSDGIFDNLEPEYLGVTPKQAYEKLKSKGMADGIDEPANDADWEHWSDHKGGSEADAKKNYRNLQPLVNRYQENLLMELWSDKKITPEVMTERAVNHALNVTAKARDDLKANRNPDKTLGKIDDVTCIAHRISTKTENVHEQDLNSKTPRPTKPIPPHASRVQPEKTVILEKYKEPPSKVIQDSKTLIANISKSLLPIKDQSDTEGIEQHKLALERQIRLITSWTTKEFLQNKHFKQSCTLDDLNFFLNEGQKMLKYHAQNEDYYDISGLLNALETLVDLC